MPRTRTTKRVPSDLTIPLERAEGLARLITDGDDREVVDCLRQMMRTAIVTVRAPRMLSAGGSPINNYEEIPDWRARGWAAVKIAESK